MENLEIVKNEITQKVKDVDANYIYDETEFISNHDFLKQISSYTQINWKEKDLVNNQVLKSFMDTYNRNIKFCEFTARKNYYVLKCYFSHLKYDFAEETFVLDEQGNQIIPRLGSTESIICIDDDNFLYTIKSDKQNVNSIVHYRLQNKTWKPVYILKNVSFKHISLGCLDNFGFVKSPYLICFKGENGSNMLYNYCKKQIMVDDYDNASNNYEIFKNLTKKDLILLKKQVVSEGYYSNLRYMINQDGVLETDIHNITRNGQIYPKSSDVDQALHLNLIYEEVKNSMMIEAKKVYTKK